MLMAVSLNLRLSYTGKEEMPWVWLIGCLCRSPILGSQADSSTGTFLPSSKWGLHQRKMLPVPPPSLSLNRMCFWLGRNFVTLIIALNKHILLLFSHPVMSDSLRPHGLQHTRPPKLHHLLTFAQVHVHCISDVIPPFQSLTPSPSALNLSQHQGLFQ